MESVSRLEPVNHPYSGCCVEQEKVIATRRGFLFCRVFLLLFSSGTLQPMTFKRYGNL